MSEWLDAYNAITRRKETPMSDDANLTIEATDVEGMVRVRTDRPGERATSAIVDGHELLANLQTILGITPELATETEQEADPQ